MLFTFSQMPWILTWSFRTIPLTEVVDCTWSFFFLSWPMAFIHNLLFFLCIKRSPFFSLTKELKAFWANHRSSSWLQFSELTKMLKLSQLFWERGRCNTVTRSDQVLEIWISPVEVVTLATLARPRMVYLDLPYLLSSDMHHRQSSPKSRMYL